jgi:hypothetical protein
MQVITQAMRTFHLEEKILKVTWDKTTYEWIFLLTKYGEDNCNLYGIHANKMY